MPTERRILFINQHYAPDVASSGQHLTDLAEHLADSGHQVEVWCGRGKYAGGGTVGERARERRNGVMVRRLPTFGLGRRNQAARVLEYAAFLFQVGLRLLCGRSPALVVFLTTPSLITSLGIPYRTLRGGRYVIWSMDIHPETEGALGILNRNGLFYRLLRVLSDRAYRGAEVVVALGPTMAQRLREKGVNPGRIQVLPVWNRKENVAPVPPGENPFRDELGLGDRFVVMYSGNAGLAHRFDEALEAAERLEDEGVVFLFVGDGARREEILEEARDRGLTNLLYREYAPRTELARSLSAGDVHLLTLRESVAGLVAPGKLYGIMAAGRPVLMVAPRESDPAHVAYGEDVGRVIEPGNDAAAQLAAAIRRLREEPDHRRRLGQRARRAFLARYERRVVCDRWSELLEQVLEGRIGAGSEHTHAA